MNYKYRVTLEGIKGFFRLYQVDGAHTLYKFHKSLRSDLEFPMDQPILFKALDADGNVIARYALIDLGYGAVDTVTIEDTIKAGAVKFVYFYDIASKKSVTITLEGETDTKVAAPTILETKGPVPVEFENGYVAFEDLPEQKRTIPGLKGAGDDEDLDGEDEDDEEEDEDKDEDKEEEEIIYDENEQ